MEPDLTISEFLVEDGHEGREPDAITDDMDVIIRAKQDFIDAIEAMQRVVPDIDAIHLEQQLDDQIQEKWDDLCKEGGLSEMLPQSAAYISWMKGRKTCY